MSVEKPYYRLVSEFSDGTRAGEEKIYNLTQIDGSWRLTRKDFAKALATIAFLFGTGTALSVCGPSKKELQRQKEKGARERAEREKAEKEKKDREGKEIKVQIKNVLTGVVETKTLPCGSPIPAGAICTCNCIPVASAPVPRRYPICRCDLVCTCDKICTCIPVV